MSSTNPVDAWSYSRYNTYKQCPLRFKYEHIDKLKTPASPAMLRGREVHKAAEHYITGVRDDIAPELDSRADLLIELRDMDPIVEQKWGFSQNWKETGWFNSARRPPVWLRATLDVGLDYKDGTFEVVDWKTGKKYGSNDEQMELFATVVMARYPEINEVTTRLSYVDMDTGPDSEDYATYKRGEFDALKTTWEHRVQPMFNDTEFLARPNRLCEYCPFSRTKGGPCRHG